MVQGLLRNRQCAIPVVVETRLEFRHDRTHHRDIEVAKADRDRARIEVVIGDIPAADDGDRRVGREQLVVHAVVKPARVKHELDALHKGHRAAIRKGIEQPDLDVVMLVERGERLARVRQRKGIQVVDEYADPDAAIRGVQHAVEEQLSGVVFHEQEVLDVQRPFRGSDQLRAQQQAIEPARKQMESRQSRMLRRLQRKLPTELRSLRLSQCRAGCLRVIAAWRQCRATRDDHHGRNKCSECANATPGGNLAIRADQS